MQLLLGIDLGAGSLKVSLITLDGRCKGEGSHAVPTHAPLAGWSEQDPQDWWIALQKSVAQALSKADVSADQIIAISFSAGAHSAVLADAAGNPLRRAIMWNDQRTGDQCQRIIQRADELVRRKSKNKVTPTWTLPHLMWLNEYEPDLVRKVERVYLAKDWLRSKLTGDWCTDITDAYGTLMVDDVTKSWSDEICQLIDWRLETLPTIVKSTDIVGTVVGRAAAETGLREGTPVICGMSDTAAEDIGAGMLDYGIGVVKLATAATMSCMRNEPNPTQSLVSYPYYPEHMWFQIAGTNSCASAHAWLRKTAFAGSDGGGKSYDEMEALARNIPAGSDGLFFHPYLNGERAPYFDPKLRASYVGMSFQHGPGHLIRALYEGVACSLRDCRRQFVASGIRFDILRATGGGARSPLWRQILANVLDTRVELTENADASFGIALVAGLGAGLIQNSNELARKVRVVAVHEPEADSVRFYDGYFDDYLRIQQALQSINHDIVERYQSPSVN